MLRLKQFLLCFSGFCACLSVFVATAASGQIVNAPLALETQPFGSLTLVDEIDTAIVEPRLQLPASATSTTTLLGRTARVMPMTTEPKAISYRIGENKGLVAGAKYLLEVEYPDDVPRATFIANRGADFVRGFATGTAIGDSRKTYTLSTLESLAYPQTQTWKSYRQLFVLHERTTADVYTQRNQMCANRTLLPANGFDVLLFQSYDRNDPRSVGVAVGKIKLWRVNDATVAPPIFTPVPSSLKQRHLYWREEMADEAAIGDTVNKRAFDDPINWFDAKMTLAIALGFDTVGKDLLEWGHNQGWDSGDSDWVNNPGPPAAMQGWKNIWSRVVTRAGERGLNVIPYYEYSGSIGQCRGTSCGDKSLGTQRRVARLFGNPGDFYTGIPWTEDTAVDITDPAAITDFRKMLDLTVVAHKEKANFLGAWLRMRQTDFPMSFSTATLARYNAENPSAPRTLQQLRDTPSSRDSYYSWWYNRRKAYLVGMRDYLRQATGSASAQMLFGAYPQETVPNSHRDATGSYVNLVTDDAAWWTAYRNSLSGGFQANWFPYNWYAISPAEALSLRVHNWGLNRFLPAVSGSEETGHSAPPADPENYATTAGVAMNFPFGNGLFTVNDAATLARFTDAEGGQYLTKHFPLNEDNGGPNSKQWSWETMSCTTGYAVEDEHPFRGLVGYVSVAVDREGPYSMLAEARALANGNPYHIAYLESSSFSRGFPEYVRRFNAALRSLPAVPAVTVAGATTTSEVVVRAYATPNDGTYYAVINTSLVAKSAVTVTLPGTGSVSDLLARAPLASNQLRFDMYSGEVRTFKVAQGSVTPGITISGKIHVAGNPQMGVSGVTFCTSDASVTCNTTDAAGNYSCTIPTSGSSGSIHPRVAGKWIPATRYSASTTSSIVNSGAIDGSCVFDIDGNGLLAPNIDGLAIVRRMAGYTDAAFSGLHGTCAQTTAPATLRANVDLNALNVNGGNAQFTTDGLMLMRALLGARGSAVTTNANNTSADVATWFANQCGGALSIGSAPVATAEVSLSANPSTINSGQSSTLTAVPVVTNTTVTSVDFLDGTTVLWSDNTSPYTFSVSPSATTSYVARVNTAQSGLTATSSPITVTVNPSAAPTLTAIVASNTRVNLSWTAVAGATSYEIERATQSGRFLSHATVAANVTAFVDEARNTTTGSAPNLIVLSNIVTEGTRYQYRVRANTVSGPSAWGSSAVTTTGATFSGNNQEPIEFRYSKLTTDSAYPFAPMNAYFALVYLPPSYFEAANANRQYPVVIFRHGLGQYGGSQGRANLTKLYAGAASGTPPHKLANDSAFRPDVIIVSPQLAWNFDDASDEEVRFMGGLRDYLSMHYRADPLAFNVTGLSAGTGPVVIHATRGGRPLASWSVVSNQGWGNSVTATGYARAAQIANWHAANLGNGGDAATQSTLVNLLLANGGANASAGGQIRAHYFCNTPLITTADPLASCTSGGGHDAWTRAYSFTNTYQTPNYWQWVATQRATP